MFTSPNTLWFVYPVLSWGVGLAIHYVTVFGIPGTRVLTDDWEEEELDKEIRKLKRIYGKKMLKKNLLNSGLDDDGLDLRELDKQAEELFDEEDLV
jgi:hypothetical protein